MLLVIDNYDSFTFNLVQAFGFLGEQVCTVRNDAVTISEIEKLDPNRIVISPGPGDPNQAGISLSVIAYASGKIPLLGVCLGHQAIAQFFGAQIVRAPVLMHGKTSYVKHDGKGVFMGIKNPVIQTRYHSLVVDPNTLPESLLETAWANDSDISERVIMGIRHKKFSIEGVQCHPESIASEQGYDLLANFLKTDSGFWK